MKKKVGKVSEPALAPPRPSQIAAGEFKARCLDLMDVVNERHTEFVITKRGKPVAKLVPVMSVRPESGFGLLRDMRVEILGDIVGPVYTAAELAGFRAEEAHLYDE